MFVTYNVCHAVFKRNEINFEMFCLKVSSGNPNQDEGICTVHPVGFPKKLRSNKNYKTGILQY